MADKKLAILIEILTKEVGQEKAADILKKVTDQTGDATSETGKLTEATGNLNVKKTDLRGIVRALSREFPLLGIAGRLALNPLVGGAIAAVAIIRKLHAEYIELQALLSRTAELTGLRGAFNGVENALVKSRSEAAGLFADLKKSSGSIKAQADEAITALDRQANKTRELMAAEKDRALAKLKFQLETGEITPDQFKAGSAAVESAASASERAVQDKLDSDKLAALQAAFTKADYNSRLTANKAPAAIEAANLAEAKSGRINDNIPSGRANLRKQGDFISELIDKRDSAARGFLDAERERLESYTSVDQAKKGEGGILAGDPRAFVELNLKIQEERQKQNRIASEQRNLESTAEPAAAEATRLRSAAEEIKNQLKQLEKTKDELRTEIERAKQSIGADKAHRDKLGAIEDQTRGINSAADFAPRLQSSLQAAVEIAGRSKGTEGLSEQEKKLLEIVGSQIAGSNVNSATADKMLELAGRNAKIRESYDKRLLDAVANMSAAVLPQFNDRLAAIEKQISGLRPTKTNPLGT